MPESHLTPPSQPIDPGHGSGPIGFRSFDLVRQYFEELASNEPSAEGPNGREAIDWDVVRESLAGSESVEEAIGRAVVIADLMSRGKYKGPGSSSQRNSSAFFSFDNTNAIANFGEKTRFRTWIAERASAHRALTSMAICVAMILTALTISVATSRGSTAPTVFKKPGVSVVSGNAQLAAVSLSDSDAGSAAVTLTTLPAATAPPAPSPPSLATAPPLRPHEVFGFAPYWTLDQSAGFDVNRISTFDYFSIPVNADGSLSESGPGWNGFQSQALTNLITRLHGGGPSRAHRQLL